MFITHVNGEEVSASTVIYGTPSFNPVYKKYAKNKEVSLEEQLQVILRSNQNSNEEASSTNTSDNKNGDANKLFYLLTEKWNGANISVFKYVDAKNRWFVSAKARSSPFVKDASRFLSWDSYFSNVKTVLLRHKALVEVVEKIADEQEEAEEAEEGKEETTTNNSGSDSGDANVNAVTTGVWAMVVSNNKPQAPKKTSLKISLESELLKRLKEASIQSITFELCGTRCPHLVRYPFDIDLIPLFACSFTGAISPFLFDPSNSVQHQISPVFSLSADTARAPSSSSSPTTVVNKKREEILPFESIEALLEQCRNAQEADFNTNEAFRSKKGLSRDRYWYGHFATEGKVLYLLRRSNDSKEDSYECVNSRNSILNGKEMVSIFKVKPRDVRKYHWEQFDNNTMVIFVTRHDTSLHIFYSDRFICLGACFRSDR